MPTAALKQIGTVDKAAGVVSVRHPDGSAGALQAGAPIYQGDVIETGADGRIGVVFVDKSTFSLGPKGRMSMDEMVFDPANPQDGHSTVAALHGAFSFVSGQIAKSTPDAMQVKTPVMTIGVRGTTVAGIAGPEGSVNTITLLRDGSGALGQVSINNAAGSIVLNSESHTIQVTSFIQPPSKPTALAAADIQALYGDALGVQPLPPANPPETPPSGETGGQQGGESGGEGPQTAQVGAGNQAADPTDPGQVVDFINATLGQIEDAGLSLEIADMLGDLTAWTVVFADDAESDLADLISEIAADEQEFLAFLEALADELDEDWDDDDDDDDDDEAGVHLVGTAGDDMLEGTDDDDGLWGLAGHDELHGYSGNDALYGDDGNDVLYGDDGDDEMEDGSGADVLYGGNGDDMITTVLDNAVDDFRGGDDNDTVSYAFVTSDAITVTMLNDFTGTMTCSGAGDTFHSIENIEGTNTVASGDNITGNFMDNKFWGGRGDDVLNGGAGEDRLYGGGENDTLTGGEGNDYLQGDAGNDVFAFTLTNPGATMADRIAALGVDIIADFTSTSDKLRLVSSTFENLPIGLLGPTRFGSSLGTLSGTDQSFGGSGAGILALEHDGNLHVYYCEDLSAANASNSYEFATLQGGSAASLVASDIVVAAP